MRCLLWRKGIESEHYKRVGKILKISGEEVLLGSPTEVEFCRYFLIKKTFLTTPNMKFLLNFIVAVLIVSVISCKKESSTLEPEKTVDYKLVDSLLTTRGRYWVIEKITKISGKEKLEYISDNGARSDSIAGSILAWRNYSGCKFSIFNRKIIQEDGGGVWGPLPYTTTGRLHVYHLSTREGGWSWASDHSKVKVKLPEILESIFRHISKVDSKSTEGYLDPTSYPVYGNVEEIKAAGKSERIRIVVDVEDRDKVSYVFTLRAVWVDSSPYGGSRVSVYDKVIY